MARHGSFHEFLVDLHAHLGPIAAFHMGTQLCVSLASAFHVRQIRHIFNRPPLIFEYVRPMIGAHSLQYANDDLGRSLRRKLDQAFAVQHMTDHYCRVIVRVGAEEIVRLHAASETTQTQRQSVTAQINSLGSRLASNSVYLCLFHGAKHDEMMDAVIDSYEIVWSAMEAALITGEDLQQNDAFQRNLTVLKDVMKGIIANYQRGHAQTEQTKNHEDSSFFLDLLHEFYENEPDKDEAVLNNVMTYFIGGLHTTSDLPPHGWCPNTYRPARKGSNYGLGTLGTYVLYDFSEENLIAFLLYYLAKHFNYQDRILREFYAASSGGASESDIISLSVDAPVKLPTLHNAIYETLRLAQIAPFAARQAPDGVHEPLLKLQLDESRLEFESVEIPANTPIIHSLGVLSQSAQVFPEPHVFNPDRFLVKPHQKSTIVKHAFEPFGFAGKRKCPGYKFSCVEVSIWTLQVLTRFQISFEYPENCEFKFVYGLVTHMDREIPLRFTPRSGELDKKK